MECVRQIIDSKLLDGLNLPNYMRNRKVEVIIIPADEADIKQKKPVENLMGILHEYADPKLIHSEKDAWIKAMVEKHADC